MRKKITVASCQPVLCLPIASAGSTTPLEAASSRSPVMRNSRLMMMTTAHAGIAGIRQMNAPETMILSTSGSINLPKSVISPYLRAM